MTLGVNDYVCKPVGYPCGQCTSFAYWRVVNDLGHPDFEPSYKGAWFGNADTWANAAAQIGLPVGSTPHRGDVAEFNPGVDGASPYGHLAVVLDIGAGTVTVEDYNWLGDQKYHQHSVPSAGLRFITFAPQPAPIPSGGVLAATSTEVDTPSEGIWLLHRGMYVHVDDPSVLDALRATGAVLPTAWKVDEAMHDALKAGSQ